MSVGDPGWLHGVLDRFAERHPQLVELCQQRDGGQSVTDRGEKVGHFTASACVVDPHTDMVLMILSPKFGCWLLPGGHIDPGEAPFDAALRELHEECGVSPDRVRALDGAAPAAINIHWVPGSSARSEPEHRHFDLQYIFELADSDSFTNVVDKREVTSIGWVPKSKLAVSYPELSAAMPSEVPHEP